MKRWHLWIAACLTLLLSWSLPGVQPLPQATGQPGPLFIVGGGRTTEVIQSEILRQLGESTRVVILPQASSRDTRGTGSVDMWRAAGASSVINLANLEQAGAREKLERADLIWMPGGSQSRLMEALAGAKLVEIIRARHRAGVGVGGTSAGAAVMGEVMIAGSPDPAALHSGAMESLRGLGVWPEAIVDQHFLARKRTGRLLTAVLDRPGLLGIGIGESTLVVVRGNDLTVLGEGNVLVYDARGARVAETEPAQVQAGTNIGLHVLRDGMSWIWAKKEKESK